MRVNVNIAIVASTTKGKPFRVIAQDGQPIVEGGKATERHLTAAQSSQLFAALGLSDNGSIPTGKDGKPTAEFRTALATARAAGYVEVDGGKRGKPSATPVANLSSLSLD